MNHSLSACKVSCCNHRLPVKLVGLPKTVLHSQPHPSERQFTLGLRKLSSSGLLDPRVQRDIKHLPEAAPEAASNATSIYDSRDPRLSALGRSDRRVAIRWCFFSFFEFFTDLTTSTSDPLFCGGRRTVHSHAPLVIATRFGRGAVVSYHRATGLARGWRHAHESGAPRVDAHARWW